MTRPTISENIIDRMVAWFDPAAGVRRRQARVALAYTGGYLGGKRDRKPTRNWRPADDSANAAITPDLNDLRARSRDLARNVPMATGAIQTVVTNVVGDGLTLRATVDRDALGWDEDRAVEWRRDVEREWALFGKRADMTRVQHFAEMQQLVFRAVLESGDVLIGRRFREDVGDAYGLKLHAIEGDRLSNPGWRQDTQEIVAGVEHSLNGVPIAYHITDRHPGDLNTTAAKWIRVSARDRDGSPLVLHLFHRQRPDQARGVPFLAPVIEAIKQIGDYSEAEIRAAVISSMFTVFVKSPGVGEGIETIIGDNANVSDPQSEIELGAGAIVDLAAGEDVTFANPTRPNTQFGEFVANFTRQIGMALGLPYEVLSMHFASSYSASRAALEMAWQFYRVRRGWLARSFCQPVYEWFLAEAVARGRVDAPGFFGDPAVRAAYCAAQWIGPSRIQLDPQKEAAADERDLAMGTKTREQIIIERTGGSFDDKHEQLAREAQRRREAGLTDAKPTEVQTDGASADQ